MVVHVQHHNVHNGQWDERTQDIAKVHNHIRGHHGVERTLTMLVQSGQKWDSMRKDVRLFVAACPFSQKMRELKPVINAKRFTTATYTIYDSETVRSY